MDSDRRSEARLYDGHSARPRRGAVDLRADVLSFRDDDGATHEWPLSSVLSIHRVADELHVEIAAPDDPSGKERPALKVVVGDPEFEARLDEARARFDASPRLAAGTAVRRLGVRGWLVVAALAIPLAWIGFTTALPHAHVLISRETEARLGEELFAALSKDWQLIEDEALTDLSARMVAELADPGTGFDVRVTFVRDATPNAFAAPGGRIVVFSGLLAMCPSADALAAVLAHEIAHVEERHGLKHLLRTLGVFYFAGCVVGGGVEEFATAETIAELSSWILVLRHSRDHEREADRIALAKLRRGGRPATGLSEFFQTLQEKMPEVAGSVPSWLSTHPPTEERIAQGLGPVAPATHTRPWMAPDEWESLRSRILEQSRKR